MHKALAAALGILALASATPILAQPISPQATAIIRAIDANGDGSADRAEYLAFRSAAMTRADRDGTVGLSLDEFRASLDPGARRTAESAFSGFDANHDGVLDATESTAYHTFVFNNVLDGDRDGVWTAQELEMLLATNPQMAGGQSGGGGQAAAGPLDPQAVITALDLDGNGSVNLNEFMTAQAARFAQFDADGSGQMSLNEFRDSLEGSARGRATAIIRTFDYNRDRRISQSEFFSYQTYIYNTFLDRNRDHAWTVEEYRAFLARGR